MQSDLGNSSVDEALGMGANISVVRVDSIASQGGATYQTSIPSGKLRRSIYTEIEQLGYGQNEDKLVNFYATKDQAEQNHRRVLELIKKGVPKSSRDEIKMEWRSSRIRNLQPVPA